MSIWNFIFGKPQKYPVDQAAAEEWAKMSFPDFQRNIASTIGGLLIEQIGVPWCELCASTTFWELNVWDDFDGAEFVNAVEKRFGISIPERDLEKIRNISDLVEYTSNQLAV